VFYLTSVVVGKACEECFCTIYKAFLEVASKRFLLFNKEERRRGAGRRGGKEARYQWLMSVILATQEAEIRRISVRSQPEQK
jgi:hypothetical protein